MTAILTVYASRLFLGQLAVVTLGFVALLQVFDLLKNARTVMEQHGDSVGSLAYYAVLRLPGTISFLLPLCVLIATLTSLARLAQHNEIVAMKAAGLSLYRFLFGLGPAVVAVAAAQWLLSDQLVPAAQRALQHWDAQSVMTSGGTDSDDGQIWIRRGSTVARIAAVLADGQALAGITLFLRDDKGNVAELLVARHARYEEGRWSLFDVNRTVLPSSGAPQRTHLYSIAWDIDLIPSDLANLTTHPSGLPLRALLALADSSGLGKHPEHFYRTWVQKRIATPVSVVVMLLLAASAAPTFVRGNSGAAGLAIGVGLGFLYLIGDGVVMTLGEAGRLPPILAAWAPLAIFGCIGGAALIVREGA